jgi:transposase
VFVSPVKIRASSVRTDFLHKRTTALVRKFGTIVVENLNVRGLAQGTSGVTQKRPMRVTSKLANRDDARGR